MGYPGHTGYDLSQSAAPCDWRIRRCLWSDLFASDYHLRRHCWRCCNYGADCTLGPWHTIADRSEARIPSLVSKRPLVLVTRNMHRLTLRLLPAFLKLGMHKQPHNKMIS